MNKAGFAFTVFFLGLSAFTLQAQIKTLNSGTQTITVAKPNGPTTTIDVAVPLKLSNPGIGPALRGNAAKAAAVIGVSSAPAPNGTWPLGTPWDENCPCGVFGSNLDENGIGVAGLSSNVGVYGYSGPGDGVVGVTTKSFGVFGIGAGSSTGVSGQSDNGAGLWGSSSNGNGVLADSSNVAVQAHNTTVRGNAAYLASRCCAGDFYGEVFVHGVLKKSAGQFQIDHPLDPTHKYLNHAFVESPDMMNIYNGNVTLDARGTAIVQLPDWFEALNQDFRYQLTALGKPGPNLYVSQEIAHNSFRIAGGRPGAKVSWQVTGVRHDPYANAHRMKVEEDKPSNEIGSYLDPELYGKEATEGLRFKRYSGETYPRRAAKQ